MPAQPMRVLLTGASGFVGRAVLRRLLADGHTAVCLVREPDRLREAGGKARADRLIVHRGDILSPETVAQAAGGCHGVIHLVGIIRPAGGGHGFQRVHVQGTRNVVEQAKAVGVERVVHMSALGARPDAPSEYHRTKFAAEQIVRDSGLAWTIFRPSVIHGPDGDFVRMMKRFVRPPIRPGYELLHMGMPYFGAGESRLQPVFVEDVALCFVHALRLPGTIGRTYALGGPEVFTWKQLYELYAVALCGRPRRMIGVPVWLAKLLARTVMRTPLVPRSLRFGVDEVLMSQEDSVCESGPVEQTFRIRLRDLRSELASYADSIP
jgi:uncharacterized protein YbjT (DUF2867 family)